MNKSINYWYNKNVYNSDLMYFISFISRFKNQINSMLSKLTLMNDSVNIYKNKCIYFCK